MGSGFRWEEAVRDGTLPDGAPDDLGSGQTLVSRQPVEQGAVVVVEPY